MVTSINMQKVRKNPKGIETGYSHAQTTFLIPIYIGFIVQVMRRRRFKQSAKHVSNYIALPDAWYATHAGSSIGGRIKLLDVLVV